jgi:transcriptional regulator with XRE-family HTH domain
MLRMAELRRKKGMTQKELGKQLGVAQTTVSAWELGTNEPDLQTLIQICGILGTSIDEMLDNPELSKNMEISRQEALEVSDSLKNFAAILQQAEPEDLDKLGNMMKVFFPHLIDAAKIANPNFTEDLQFLGGLAKELEDTEE